MTEPASNNSPMTSRSHGVCEACPIPRVLPSQPLTSSCTSVSRYTDLSWLRPPLRAFVLWLALAGMLLRPDLPLASTPHYLLLAQKGLPTDTSAEESETPPESHPPCFSFCVLALMKKLVAQCGILHCLLFIIVIFGEARTVSHTKQVLSKCQMKDRDIVSDGRVPSLRETQPHPQEDPSVWLITALPQGAPV